MKPYEYQILRYIPDQVSGEFLNVGIVLYGKREHLVYFEFLTQRQRISEVFKGIDSSHIIKSLRRMNEKLVDLTRELNMGFPGLKFNKLTDYTTYILKKDDSALQFSEVKMGIDLSSEAAFEDLKQRLLYKWITERESYKTDEDVWREKYKVYFEQRGLFTQLEEKIIKTNTDELHFNQAYKNGVWNLFQPLNLNLKKDDSIRGKVYKWKGILSELATADEEIKLVFLSEQPTEQLELREFIRYQLDNFHHKKVSTKLLEPGETEVFLDSLIGEN